MMLDGIRNNAQSWGVKIAFGIIILVFVFWGVGSYTGPKGLVATVNGKNITEVEFQRAYAQMEDNIRRSAPNLTPEMMEGLSSNVVCSTSSCRKSSSKAKPNVPVLP